MVLNDPNFPEQIPAVKTDASISGDALPMKDLQSLSTTYIMYTHDKSKFVTGAVLDTQSKIEKIREASAFQYKIFSGKYISLSSLSYLAIHIL